MIKNSNKGAAAPSLWCVELVPKRRRLTTEDSKKLAEMAKGMPPDDKGALLWLVQAVTGFIDERSPQFERDRQRLVVFREKRKAAERAKAKSNESWSGKVRPVKIV